MGFLGSQIGGAIGQGAGTAIGNKYLGPQGGKTLGEVGKILGTAGGMAFPLFKKGGMVKPPKNKKTQKAILHKGELVIPASMVKDVPKSLKKKIAKKGGVNMKK